MKLVEAEATGPVEGDAALVTPPRPPHRRVSVSLMFTLTVLISTVVAVYVMFPARHNVLVTEAIAHHRDPPAVWDLAAPSAAELRAWAIGVAGKEVPLPQSSATVIGARRLDLFDRGAALVRLRIGGDEVTYLVQHVRGIAPERADRIDGELRAVAWTRGPFACVAVGPAGSAARWLAAVGGPL
ncbi:MAG TPA: hypothetical protein VLX92_29995 [Kofleriaceae bacterium]|nr:hypothetical protein [Kofleriaceae bacterium]